MKLVLQSVPTSTNKLERMHWAVKKKLRVTLEWELLTAWSNHGSPMKSPGKRRVVVEVWRPRRLDPDNAKGGCKVLLDAMRDVGLLKNDSPKWLEFPDVIQHVEKSNPRTEITIEDI